MLSNSQAQTIANLISEARTENRKKKDRSQSAVTRSLNRALEILAVERIQPED